MEEKQYLDMCCGGKMFWFDRNNPNVLFIDIRRESKGFIRLRPSYEVQPDIQMDFRHLEFPDERFKGIIFDPPHILAMGNKPTKSWMKLKYGSLNMTSWKDDLRKGFTEAWRVLKNDGWLIFKWCETDVSLKEVLELTEHKPWFGHTTLKRKAGAIWIMFVKQDVKR